MARIEAFEDRQDAILDAAFKAFSTYGYRRATMDDIARGAGLSRTALYLSFRNKDDIFRSLAERYFSEAERDMRLALAVPDKDPATTLAAAFAAKDGKFMDVVLGTPHGRELLDAGLSVSAGIAEEGERRMTDCLAEWFSAQELQPGIGTPQALAESLKAALKGLKLSAVDLQSYREGQALLARVYARAIASKP